MTALRIFSTAKPSLVGARVLPMSREDEKFWRLQRKRHPRAPSPSKRNP